jgi:putative phosphoesterase
VRICIISDIHANAEALSALPDDYDELWVLGDLVNYGPDPAAVVDFVRSKAAVVIRGNHDHSVGFDADCGCSPRFRAMAEATRNYAASVLTQTNKQYLHDLPLSARRQADGIEFFFCHATPSDLLYEYRKPDSPLWEKPESASAGAAVILAGHTHLQFSRTADGRTIVNPGSLGQSKMGDPRARYAICENGRFALKAVEYPFQRTIEKVMAMPIDSGLKNDLVHVLATGRVPL